MYRSKKIAAVIPAYNEEKLIGKVIDTMPDFVDTIVVVNDCSKDNTEQAVKLKIEAYAAKLRAIPGSAGKHIVLLKTPVNQGVGGALAVGFKFIADSDHDIAFVMDGDAQMDPTDLPRLLDPVVEDRADYAKGNRFMSGEAYKVMPKVRFFGNAALSLLTKIASGYWHISDSQTGYRAMGIKAIKTLDWDKSYKRYGQPNDILVSLNIHNFRVIDVPVKPIYGVGEVSTLKVRKAIFTIGWLLVRLFFKRIYQKYVVRDFHPLVFFYLFGLGLFILAIPLGLRAVFVTFERGSIPHINFLFVLFLLLSSVQFTLFAMWFDLENNKELKGKLGD